MAAGLPVVARPEAVQGLPEAARALRVAATPEDFAKEIISLYGDKAQCGELGRLGQAVVEQQFRWREHLETFTRCLDACGAEQKHAKENPAHA
jgi:hypothetical protein